MKALGPSSVQTLSQKAQQFLVEALQNNTVSQRIKRDGEKQNSRVAWERIAHPHTDLQVQICYLQQAIY